MHEEIPYPLCVCSHDRLCVNAHGMRRGTTAELARKGRQENNHALRRFRHLSDGSSMGRSVPETASRSEGGSFGGRSGQGRGRLHRRTRGHRNVSREPTRSELDKGILAVPICHVGCSRSSAMMNPVAEEIAAKGMTRSQLFALYKEQKKMTWEEGRRKERREDPRQRFTPGPTPAEPRPLSSSPRQTETGGPTRGSASIPTLR